MNKKSTIYKFFPCLYMAFFFMPVLFTGHNAFAEDYKNLMRKGIETFNMAYNNWDEKQFQESLDLFKKASLEGRKDGLAEYWAGTAHFFLSQYYLFTNEEPFDRKKGIENAKNGIDILTKAIEMAPDFSESYALRGVLRGILIKMKPSSVFSQGRKVGKDREKALALDNLNPRVHYLTGTSFWHAPEILGGRDKALEHLFEAEKLFEREAHTSKDKLLPSWGRSTCLAFIGDVLMTRKEESRAFDYYKKALDVNPVDPLALRGLGNRNGHKDSNNHE